jgi:hypothetical protein
VDEVAAMQSSPRSATLSMLAGAARRGQRDAPAKSRCGFFPPRVLAQWIGPYLASAPTEVIVVDRRIYGLPFYLNEPFELLTRRPERIPEYQPTTERWDEEVAE